jgi:lipopolysaccharide/colanic/teichoic acid biosynthesis glycosyltransferase
MEATTISMTKRGIDLVVGTTILLAAAPVLLLIAIAIKLTSHGPILYRQKRMGVISPKNRFPQEFEVFKFRTMVQNAEQKTGVVLSKKGDPRTTPVGRFLRETRLDELPQFLNVIKGDMSIVGPRPERPELMSSLTRDIPFFEERTRYIKPGITGLAQVSLSYAGGFKREDDNDPVKRSLVHGRPEKNEDEITVGMRTKFIYDMVYSSALERFTSFLVTDLSIMVKTPIVMFIYRTGQ